jgi:hypothetical protein
MPETVLIVCSDASRTETISREYIAMRFCPVIAGNAADALTLFDDVRPELLCVDESIDVRPEWPLFHEIAIQKRMRSVPMILMIDSTKTREYAFPKDHCVCRVRKGPRLMEAVRAFSEEFISARHPFWQLSMVREA